MENSIISNNIHGIFPAYYELPELGFDKEKSINKYKESVTKWILPQEFITRILSDPPKEVESPIWKLKPSEEKVSLNDFFPHIRQILGEKGKPNLAMVFEMANPHMLSQIKGGKKRIWEFGLEKAATQRTGLKKITLMINGARFYLFRTRIGILDLHWQYLNSNEDQCVGLSIDDVLEGNYHLSHDNHATMESESKGPRILRELAEVLLPEIDGIKPNTHSSRRILYSFINYRLRSQEIPENIKEKDDSNRKSNKEELRIFALRLSHRQTKSYNPKGFYFKKKIFHPFPYLIHASGIEGGATIVLTRECDPEVLRNFIDDKGKNTYLPLFISAMHSHFWLLNQSQWLPERLSSKDSRSEKLKFAALYESVVEYQRYFYPALVSQVSVHNQFHEHWQKVLKIKERLENIKKTSQITVSLIQERRTQWIAIVSGAVGGFLVGREILEAISYNGYWENILPLKEWIVRYPHMSSQVQEMYLNRIKIWERFEIIGSFMLALLGGLLAWIYGKSMEKDM